MGDEKYEMTRDEIQAVFDFWRSDAEANPDSYGSPEGEMDDADWFLEVLANRA